MSDITLYLVLDRLIRHSGFIHFDSYGRFYEDSHVEVDICVHFLYLIMNVIAAPYVIESFPK